MANQTEFKVIVTYEDGQAKVKIEELTAVINKNSAASKQAASSTDELGNANKRLKEPLEGTIGALEKENAELLKQIKNQTTSTVEGAKLAKRYQQNSIEIQRMTAEMGLFNKVNQGMISNTGLAGATLTEFGRTLSDAPYGIQGVANNLSQLSSLFTTFVSKTEGGVIPALRQLGREFIGPLGIVIAIQAALAAWEFLSKRQKDATDSSKEVRLEYQAQGAVLNEYVDVLEDASTSEEQRAAIIDKLKQEVEGLTDADFEYGKSLDEVRSKIEKTMLAEAAYAEVQKLRSESQSLIIKKLDVDRIDSIKNEEERLESMKQMLRDSGYIVDATTISIGTSSQRVAAKTVEEVENLFKDLQTSVDKEYAPIAKRIRELTGDFLPDVDSTKDESDKILDIIRGLNDELSLSDKEGFDEKIERNRIQFEDTVAKINASTLTQIQKDEAISIANQIRYNKDKAVFDEIQEYLRDQENKTEDLRQKSLDKQSKERQKFYKNNLKEILDTNKQEIAAETAVAIKGVKIRKEAQSKKRDIEIRGLNDLKDTLKSALEAGIITAEQYAAEIARIEGKLNGLIISGLTGAGDKELSPEQRKEKALRATQDTINAVENALNAQFDAEISREEAKTEKINNELRKRLNNEKLTAEERENLNLLIAQNEEQLQQKRDEISEKNFKAQKAVSIANSIMATYEAANNALKDIPTPFNFAAMAAVITAGLINVKSIAEQQFVPSAISVPSVSGAGSSQAPIQIQAPNFNVVGASNQNQLAEAINAKLDKPIEAFVVSKNIKTALELDRNKVQSAGL